MRKAKPLQKGDKIAIVSLSSGILGEPFIKHELDIALKRLKEYELEVVLMPNALKGLTYIEEHPESRAADLKEAFLDPTIKAIICAIGGNDTYKIFPHLMEDKEFIQAIKENPKIFTGFSDSTMDHLMLYKLGLNTFYGPCLLVDIAELDHEMLPYTKKYFEKYFEKEEHFRIESSPFWYQDRESYGVEQVGVSRIKKEEMHGYEVLNGSGIATGKLLGGCIESIYDAMTEHSSKEELEICNRYQVLPSLEEWKNKVLFLETSDAKVSPEELEIMLEEMNKRGIFEQVSGLIIGKPIDEKYYEEYKEIYKKIFKDKSTPILYNLNFGHSVPKCIIPYGIEAEVDYDNKTVTIVEPIFE